MYIYIYIYIYIYTITWKYKTKCTGRCQCIKNNVQCNWYCTCKGQCDK